MGRGSDLDTSSSTCDFTATEGGMVEEMGVKDVEEKEILKKGKVDGGRGKNSGAVLMARLESHQTRGREGGRRNVILS